MSDKDTIAIMAAIIFAARVNDTTDDAYGDATEDAFALFYKVKSEYEDE